MHRLIDRHIRAVHRIGNMADRFGAEKIGPGRRKHLQMAERALASIRRLAGPAWISADPSHPVKQLSSLDCATRAGIRCCQSGGTCRGAPAGSRGRSSRPRWHRTAAPGYAPWENTGCMPIPAGAAPSWRLVRRIVTVRTVADSDIPTRSAEGERPGRIGADDPGSERLRWGRLPSTDPRPLPADAVDRMRDVAEIALQPIVGAVPAEPGARRCGCSMATAGKHPIACRSPVADGLGSRAPQDRRSAQHPAGQPGRRYSGATTIDDAPDGQGQHDMGSA